MGTATETEVWGVSEGVQGIFGRHPAALENAAIDVREALARMRAMHAEAFAANQLQESLKEQLKAQTEVSRVLIRKLYLTMSGYLDMAIAAVGKGTALAKQLQRVRSRIRRPAAEAVSAVQPVPEATQ